MVGKNYYRLMKVTKNEIKKQNFLYYKYVRHSMIFSQSILSNQPAGLMRSRPLPKKTIC